MISFITTIQLVLLLNILGLFLIMFGLLYGLMIRKYTIVCKSIFEKSNGKKSEVCKETKIY
jgi:hypothetical protein